MKKPFAATCLLLAACGSVQIEAPPAVDGITPLEQACLRDPLDPERWEQLAAALAVAGERERAAVMYLQGASLRKHDVQQDYATLKAALDDSGPRTQVRRIAPGLVAVSRSHAVAAANEAANVAASIVRLEISNGNGVTGAAARLARSLDVDGVKTVRLSNLRPFVVPQSRIEYQQEQQQMAQALGRRLGLPLQPARGATAYADLRIVLGRDVRYLK